MQSPLTLLHVSDLHFVNDQSIFKGLKENGNLFSKRHLGWLNFKLRRYKHFQPSLKDDLLKYLNTNSWDYLIITGDVTTLALRSEFEMARKSLEPLIKKGNVLFTTGNHDRYVKTHPEPNLLATYFSDCWPFNELSAKKQTHSFYELGDSAVLLELKMAIPKPFFSSRGRFNKNLTDIKDHLKNKYKDRIKLAIGHYPAFIPPGEHEGFFHSLAEQERLRRFLLEFDFRFYLHGHIHKSWMFNPVESSNLTCVNSGGCCRHAQGEFSGFHKITLSPENISIERLNC